MHSVSVVIPTYNSGALVVNAIESVFAQTWPATEIIVVDDGSTDNTAATLQGYSDRIVYLPQRNRGRSAARNSGILAAKSDFVAFLDADDIWYQPKLERQITSLQRHPGTKWASAQSRLLDKDGFPLQSTFWPETGGSGLPGAHAIQDHILSGKISVETSTVVVCKECLLQVGLFDEQLPTAEDTDLWNRLAQQAGPMLFVSEVLGARRVNTDTTFLERLINYGYSETAPRALLKALGGEIDPNHSRAEIKDALCRAYLNSTFIELAQGRIPEARHYFREASVWSEQQPLNTTLARQLSDFALLAARYHPNGPLEAERVLRLLLSALPGLVGKDLHVERSALSELYATIAYIFQTKQQARQMAKYARRALRVDPGRFRDIGLVKRAIGFDGHW